jgi:hypothetical protein
MTDVASLVLASKSLGELRQSWPRFRVQDIDALIWDAPTLIFIHLLEDPSSTRRWEAVYHYKSMTDASATLAFASACFDVVVEHPTLFRDRYVRGDDRAAELMYWAMWADRSAKWRNHYGAAKAHAFKDAESLHTWIFIVLETGGPKPRTATESWRRRRFTTNARRTFAEAKSERKANAEWVKPK